jgi:hypothetical protein
MQQNLTPNEEKQLDAFNARMRRVFGSYRVATGEDFLFESSSHGNNNSNGSYSANSSSSGNSSGNSSSSSSSSNNNKRKNAAATSSSSDLRRCYDDIPELYFEPHFSLKSQPMFDEALGAPTVDAMSDGSRQSHEEREVFQDKLSRYLDLIEMALLRQIWTQSQAFFRALDDMKSLQLLVSGTAKELEQIRSRLKDVRTTLLNSTMKIPKINTKLRNTKAIHEKLECMQQVVHAQRAISAQLEGEDYSTALELVLSAKAKFVSHDMAAIEAMRGIGAQLDDFDALVGNILYNKFVSVAIRWTDGDGEGLGAPDSVLDSVLGVGSSSSAVSGEQQSLHQSIRTPMQTTLLNVLTPLVATNRIPVALSMYKVRLLEAVRLIIRTCVTEYLTDFDPSNVEMDYSAFDGTGKGDGKSGATGGGGGGGDTTTSFGQKVREMSNEAFLSCLALCFEQVTRRSCSLLTFLLTFLPTFLPTFSLHSFSPSHSTFLPTFLLTFSLLLSLHFFPPSHSTSSLLLAPLIGDAVAREGAGFSPLRNG